MYSIVKVQQNFHNDMCALLGLMRVFAVGWAYMGRWDEGWGYDELMYPYSLFHLSPPNLHTTQVFTLPTPDRIRTARHTPLSPPSPNAHPPYLPYIHPTQLHSRANSTPTNPILPWAISTTLRTLSHPQTHHTASQPDPLPHLNPTHLSNHTCAAYYRNPQTLTPPNPICPTRHKDSHQSY